MLQTEIEELFDHPPGSYQEAHFQLFERFKQALNEGVVRSAEPDPDSPTGWRVNAWVKKGILLGFRLGAVVDMSIDAHRQPFFDKATYPVKQFQLASGVRIVPGGSSIRDGCYVGRGVTCMPPMYINVGAYVGDGTMVDSHALIGSCAQVGKNCHISAAAQIGGVLEPVGAMPVIIEDEVLIGGNCGVYEGTIVKRRAVLGTGTILNRSTPVYDLVKQTVLTASADQPLVIPEGAVVVAGARAVTSSPGKEWGISLYTPVIVKYRDEKTDAKIQLEELLR
ncbi:MAG: 2,3,4,5-tetrahydropyridine-2,6-dicarboxylate N-succinyltransferase [Bryobacteraceae bacterium]|nr:2,3,4,5-tetrahydropyridine-2,6-dicarboxylate N-succinyltransferase [Bryobacteraceae bacterium]MDW8379175.1 2,3,4,5-tetrahydropyridine-2,6-dicarboxylate N-succinyltransferase [Bryobacterales bacterium]